MGSNTSKRRPRKRDRRRDSRAPYPANAPRRPQAPDNLWLTWGLPAAGVVITFELLYYTVFADALGGTSVLGVLGAAACAFAAQFASGLSGYVSKRRTEEFPFAVVGTVMGAGAAVAVLIQVVFMS